MVKIRQSKEKFCDSCESNGGKFYDIGIGLRKDGIRLVTLCDTCMHTLLQKLIIVGKDFNNEVH